MTPVLITAILWIAFVVYWLLAARHSKRTVARGQPIWLRIIVFAIMAAFVALYYLPLSSVPFLGWRFLPARSVLTVIGPGMMVIGLLFAVWARRTLAGNWSGAVVLKEGHTLLTSGPYAIVRHPIYLGVFTAMLGNALVIGELRALLPFVIGLFGIWKKIAAEEVLLRSAFPGEYEIYARRVKRIIPGLL